MAASRRKLIVVSNRGPASYDRDLDGTRIARRGGGGLVTALRGLLARHDVTWIASVMSAEDFVVADENRGRSFPETSRDGSSFRLRLVAHPIQAYDWYYNVVSNPTLWFIQHYLWDLKAEPNLDFAFHYAWRKGYKAVNRNFADAVLEELEHTPDATVFFHDYHLYLAPRMVRDARPETTLQQFVHIPWPQADYWHVLPLDARQEIHLGLLANDVVGFHSDRWRRSFLRSCEDFVALPPDYEQGTLELEGRTVRPRCSRPSGCSRSSGRRSSCSASTGRTRRRTSCAGSARSSSSSTSTRTCTVAYGCSRCSIPRARTSPSTPSTSVRSSARRAA